MIHAAEVAREGRGSLRERPGDDDAEDLRAYLAEESAVAELEVELAEAEASLADARAIATALQAQAGGARRAEDGSSEGTGFVPGEGGGTWQGGIQTPMQPNRTLRSRATDDVGDEDGGIR